MPFKITKNKIAKDEMSFEIKVDFDRSTPEEDRNGVLADIGDFVKNSILDYVGDSDTPIEGGKWRAELTDAYKKKKEKESGVTTANMELFGDMLDAFDYEITDNSVRFFIDDDDQAVKAYGHNTGFEGHPTIKSKKYKREFIPKKGQTFKKDIMSGIDDILDEYAGKNKN